MEPDTVSNNVTGSLLVCKKKLKIPMYSSASLGADSTGQEKNSREKKYIFEPTPGYNWHHFIRNHVKTCFFSMNC